MSGKAGKAEDKKRAGTPQKDVPARFLRSVRDRLRRNGGPDPVKILAFTQQRPRFFQGTLCRCHGAAEKLTRACAVQQTQAEPCHHGIPGALHAPHRHR